MGAPHCLPPFLQRPQSLLVETFSISVDIEVVDRYILLTMLTVDSPREVKPAWGVCPGLHLAAGPPGDLGPGVELLHLHLVSRAAARLGRGHHGEGGGEQQQGGGHGDGDTSHWDVSGYLYPAAQVVISHIEHF